MAGRRRTRRLNCLCGHAHCPWMSSLPRHPDDCPCRRCECPRCIGMEYYQQRRVQLKILSQLMSDQVYRRLRRR